MDPSSLFMLAGVLLYFWIGDWSDALWLSSFWFVMVLMSVAQAWRGDRALRALLSFVHPWVRVIETGDGGTTERFVRAEDLTVGSLIRLEEGERIPLDCTVEDATRLEVDESFQTGETMSVARFRGDRVAAGALVLSGTATARVVTPWHQSEWQGIRQVVEESKRPRSFLSAKITKSTHALSILALVLAATVAWKSQSLLLGIAVALAFLPNELPAILTLFTSFAALRLARCHVLVRDLRSVEELGRLTLLALDKTGTLTEHRLRLSVMEPASQRRKEDLQETLWNAGASHAGRDPIDRELQSVLASGRESVQSRFLRDYPIQKQDRVATYAYTGKGNSVEYFCKGAPEDVLRRCQGVSDQEVARSEELAALGLRVLGAAKTQHPRLVDSINELCSWSFMGWVAFEDPLRQEAPQLVGKLQQMGISLRLITGDHPATALAVSQALGFGPQDRVLSRITPLEKKSWVEKWISESHRVGMTGDGVNDAPALRSAHVGIAMARSGTDVAREASSVLLLEDDLFDLGVALEWARGLSHQLQSVLVFLLAAHIPLIAFTLLPLIRPTWVSEWLGPAQIAFLHLAIEPVAALAFALRPRRAPPESHFQWRKGLILGLILTLGECIFLRSFPAFQSGGRVEILALLLTGTLFSLPILVTSLGREFWLTSLGVLGVWLIFTQWSLGRELMGGDFSRPLAAPVGFLCAFGWGAGLFIRWMGQAILWDRRQTHQKLDANPMETGSESEVSRP